MHHFWSFMATPETSGEKKTVVVIGGGVGGSLLSYSLQFSAHVVFIDQKDFFEIPWASLRAMVEPSFAERSVINHSNYLSNVQIVISTAINITGSEVFTADGQVFKYDYLVVSTGHVESGCKTRAEKLSYYQTEFEKISSANSILIVGGGPTGVELAGEIAVDFPKKKVTLVHRGLRLLEFIGAKASQKALHWLTKKKVEVILDQSVDLNSASNGVYHTSGGETIKADCHFLCTGKPIGSAWLKETVLKDKLDYYGRMTVDEHLRVRGYKNVFAIGDITDVAEIKQGYLAHRHAEITAKNLKLLLHGGRETHLYVYKPGSAISLVSLGRKEAVAQFPLITLIGYLPGIIKSGDLFVGKTRKQLGLKPTLDED